MTNTQKGLKYCEPCLQMTNHNDTTCLKCGKADSTVNTPDAEKITDFFDAVGHCISTAKPQNFTNVRNKLTQLLTKVREERDTYWKERVEGMKLKLELEYVEGECVECGGTGEGSDNPNSNSSETYTCYLCKGKGRFSGYTKKTVDTLLDNLK